MIKNAYARGFMSKCAERRVSYNKLVNFVLYKVAQVTNSVPANTSNKPTTQAGTASVRNIGKSSLKNLTHFTGAVGDALKQKYAPEATNLVSNVGKVKSDIKSTYHSSKEDLDKILQDFVKKYKINK